MEQQIVVTGVGQVRFAGEVESACDPLARLVVPKTRKFMGLQDDMAVVATGDALDMAGLGPEALGERAGLYLAVGYIPFERKDIERLVTRSTKDGRIDMPTFSRRGFRAIHPLLTFRCLPNMPAFHISTNYDVQGPYHVTYPGPGQLYLALEQAAVALRRGQVEVAIVGGVAHQRNFLVAHLERRVEPPTPLSDLADAAGVLVLETADAAADRGAAALAALDALEIGYRPHDPFEEALTPKESFEVGPPDALAPHAPSAHLGAASLPAVLAASLAGGAGALRHRLLSRDGIEASSAWGAP